MIVLMRGSLLPRRVAVSPRAVKHALTNLRDRPHDAGVKQVTIRIELRVSEEMNEFLATEAHARKLSFEGLLVSWVEERMQAQREHSRRGARR
jgi:hypothetical protein